MVQKTAETLEDFIGNKVADKITSAGKSKKDDKQIKKNKFKFQKKKYNKLSIT